MIESIEFTNFKALRHTTLPLAPFTLLLGPNGSGKSTVLQVIQDIAVLAQQPVRNQQGTNLVYTSQVWATARSVTAKDPAIATSVKLRLRWKELCIIAAFNCRPNDEGDFHVQFTLENGSPYSGTSELLQWFARMKKYALDPVAIAQPCPVSSKPMGANGQGLPAVLDNLKDNYPERWDSLLAEMRRWLPEYDHIVFDKPDEGSKGIALRTKKGGHRIPAKDLSQGTLVALALLTLAYLPDPPSVVGLEEIDHSLHPRLLRNLQDALYRLSYPESCGEKRPPIQVIATTHSPYLLDLYRDHPEEVVLAQKEGLEVEMKRLTDIEHYADILGESPLSEMWYSGILGGVSVRP